MAKVHRTELPYDPMPRAVSQDRAMPFDALGVYTWARSLPDGAELSVQAVVDQGRGLGMTRATAAVNYLRTVGLWHTITVRTHDRDKPLQSVVIVPPDPWPRARAVETAKADNALPVGQIVDGPADVRIRRIAAGQPDTSVSDGLSADTQRADTLPPDRLPSTDHSLNGERRTTPPTPRAAGGANCTEHNRPTRGCCSRRDLERAASAAASADRRSWPRWCGDTLCRTEDRVRFDTGRPCPDCHPIASKETA